MRCKKIVKGIEWISVLNENKTSDLIAIAKVKIYLNNWIEHKMEISTSECVPK